jgi:hypothetical protein
MKHLINTFFAMIFIYLLFAFTLWQFDFSIWTQESRNFIAVVWLIVAIFGTTFYSTKK